MKHLISKLGPHQLHWLRLAGSLLIIIGILQVVATVAWMSDAWDSLNNFNHCTPADSSICAEALFRVTGVSVWAGQTHIDNSQFLRILVGPTVHLFFWLVVLCIGMMLYKWRPYPMVGEGAMHNMHHRKN